VTYEVSLHGTTRTIDVERLDDQVYRVVVDGGPERVVDVRRPEPGVLSVLLDRKSYEAALSTLNDGFEVDLLGVHHPCAVVDPRRAALKLGGGAAEGVLTTSMPGRVVRLLVAAGDDVEVGSPLLVLEAMKMENELKAAVAGTVSVVHVEPGEALEAGAKLLEIV